MLALRHRRSECFSLLCLLLFNVGEVDCFVSENTGSLIPKPVDKRMDPETLTKSVLDSSSFTPFHGPADRRGVFGVFVTWTCLPMDSCNAADPVTLGESIRSAASKGLPSYYGPTDVFYPSTWKGLWNARRIRADDSIAANFQVRFIPSIQDDSVILDRGFSQASLENAKGVTSTEWVETNPNILRVNYTDGSWKELKVTQRATERTDFTVSSSEVFRITTQTIGVSVPSIVARRVLTKWKAIDQNKIEGIELIYDTNQEPKLLAKTKITLER